MEIPFSVVRPTVLLKLSPADIRGHLHNLIRDGDCSLGRIHAINTELLYLINIEAIPSTIYAFWLRLALEYNAVDLFPVVLRNAPSAGVRVTTILELGRVFRGPQWKQLGWDPLGGVAGIAEIFDQLSVKEVRLMCEAIGQLLRVDSNSDNGKSEVVPRVEGLLRTLLAGHSSKRPLLSQLAPLLPICRDESLILRFLSAINSAERHRLLHRLAHAQPNLMRNVAVGSVSAELDLRKKIIECFTTTLIAAQEPYVLLNAEITVPGMFPGMDFMLHLMSQLERNRSLQPDDRNSFKNNMEYTLRLAAKRKVPFSYILQYLQRCIPLYTELHINPNAILYRHFRASYSIQMELIRCWSIARFGSTGPKAKFIMKRLASRQHVSRPRAEHSEALEALLVGFLQRRRAPKNVPTRLMVTEAMHTILPEITPQGRLPFLVLFFRHVIDFEAWPPPKMERNFLLSWESGFFDLFLAEDAKKLFDRSRFRDPDEGSILDNANKSDSDLEIESVLTARCEATDMGSTFTSTRAAIRDIQQRSEKSKEAWDRCNWACHAVRVALACHSLDILYDVIQWCRRFTRDPFTVPLLVGNTLLSQDVAKILACTEIPPSRKPRTISALRDLVSKANRILETLLGILLATIAQPFGLARGLVRITRQVSVLFRKLVTYRLEGVKNYRKDHLGSEPDLTEALLDSLTPMILEYERAAIVSEDPKGKWSRETGLLSDLNCPSEPSLTAVLYLSRLARERDSLWQREREKKTSRLASLNPGWPRGLAIQHLMPSLEWTRFILDMNCTEEEPYVRSRVYGVLFGLDAVQEAKEEDEEAAGVFVDSLAYAIRCYVDGHNRKEIKKRAFQVWGFYEEMLVSYPTQKDTFRHWLATLLGEMEARHSSNISRAINPPPVPNISYLDGLDTPTNKVIEWDPRKGTDLDGSNSELIPQRPRSLLQCRTQTKDSLSGRDFDWKKGPGEPDSRWIWALKRYGSNSPKDIVKLSLQTREAVALSALLFLNTLTPSPRILSNAYPLSPDASRYPSIHLDDEFVASLQDDLGESVQAAVQALKATVSVVPTRLLRDLAVSYLDALSTMTTSSPSFTLLQRCTFSLIKLFPLSDRPELAVDVVLRVLQDYPDLSSYHRHMRLASLAGRLSPSSANALLTGFTNFVCERLCQPSPQHRQQMKDKPSPRVKVTTAKQLAGLLRHTDLFPLLNCLQALESLFNASMQNDIRCAVVIPWLDLIVSSSHYGSDANVEICHRFTTCVVTAAAVPNEGLQSDRNDGDHTWQEEGKLPLVSLERPLLLALVESARHRLPDNLRRQYLANTLLPVIDSLSVQNRRWIESLLSKVDLSPEEAGIPTDMPFKPEVIDLIMKHWSSYLPVSFLSRNRLVNMSYLSHKAMDRTTEALVRADPDFLHTNAGKHWTAFLSVLRKGNPFSSLESEFWKHTQKARDSGGLSFADLADEYCFRVAIVAHHPVVFRNDLKRFVVSTDVLTEGLGKLKSDRDRLHGDQNYDMARQVTELMERAVGEIESVRAKKNNSKDNPEADPIILPSFLELKTILLPSPKCDLGGFANGFLRLIRSVSTDPIGVVELEDVGIVKGVPRELSMECAILIGRKEADDDNENALCYTLRVRAARYLLGPYLKRDRLSDDGVLAMLETWTKSDVEYVRKVGWELLCALP